jgi:hypothetical protein
MVSERVNVPGLIEPVEDAANAFGMAPTRAALFHELPSLDRRYCYIDACFLHRGCIDQRDYYLVVHEFGHPVCVLLSTINVGP